MTSLVESTVADDSTIMSSPQSVRCEPGPGRHHARWASALSLALHAAGLVCLLTLPPASGGNGLDNSMLVEFVPMAAIQPAPAAPEPAPPTIEQPPPEQPKPKALEHLSAAKPASTAPALRKKVDARPNAEQHRDDGRDEGAAQAATAAQPVMSEPVPPSQNAATEGAPGLGAGPPARVAELHDYSGMVWARIMRFKPDRARYPGTAIVRFAITHDGSLATVEVSEPSGVPALDLLALDIVRRAAPFPPPPAGAEALTAFNIPFQFR